MFVSVDQLKAQNERRICYQAGNWLVMVTADHDPLNFFIPSALVRTKQVSHWSAQAGIHNKVRFPPLAGFNSPVLATKKNMPAHGDYPTKSSPKTSFFSHRSKRIFTGSGARSLPAKNLNLNDDHFFRRLHHASLTTPPQC